MTNETDINLKVKKLALEYSHSIVKKLIIIALDAKTPPSLVIQAANIVLDRGIGRVKSAIEVQTGQATFIDILRGLNAKSDADVKKDMEDSQLSLLKDIENLKKEEGNEDKKQG